MVEVAVAVSQQTQHRCVIDRSHNPQSTIPQRRPPFRSATFDRVLYEGMPIISFSNFRSFRNIGALAETRRVLRPGGRFDILIGDIPHEDEIVILRELDRLGFTDTVARRTPDTLLISARAPG